jgi:thiol-disulfide isomerase/thioredoxin
MTMKRRDLLRSSLALPALPLLACATPEEQPPEEAPANPMEGLTDFSGAPKPPPPLVGQVTVVDFWASWCGPCRQAFLYLDQLQRTFEGDGLKVWAVSVDEDPRAGRAFAARFRPRFEIAWDPSGAVRDRFLVQGLPTTLLIDSMGRLVHRHQGFDTRSHRLLESQVRRLVRG